MGSRIGRPVAALAGVLIAAAIAAAGNGTLYVDRTAPFGGDGQSWDTAFWFLKDGLDAARESATAIEEIRVAGGVYFPDQDKAHLLGTDDRNATFTLVGGVAVVGGYAGFGAADPDERDIDLYPTMLSGHISTYNWCYHVVTCKAQESAPVLDGVRIREGHAIGTCCVNDRGAGLYLSDSRLLVVDCRFIRNSAKNCAGGVWCAAADVVFVNCMFEQNVVTPGNSGAAIHDAYNSNVTLVDCRFLSNRIGMMTTGGGAVYVAEGSSLLADRSIFFANDASSGGAILNHGLGRLTNCLFIANDALGDGYGEEWNGRGGAVLNTGRMRLTNCTFFANTARYSGGGIYSCDGRRRVRQSHAALGRSPTILTNCILWDNMGTGDEESQQIGAAEGALCVNYSCIAGLTGELGGEGNIGEDPLFVDETGGDGVCGTLDDDLHLMPGSPCIDAADNTAVPEHVETDLDGLPRFVDDPATEDTGVGNGPIVDMGVYEFQVEPCPADVTDDGIVDVLDLLAVLGAWGATDDLPEDVNSDGVVDVLDLLEVLGAWGPCS